jgi:hypothetical protein
MLTIGPVNMNTKSQRSAAGFLCTSILQLRNATGSGYKEDAGDKERGADQIRIDCTSDLSVICHSC